jgi:RNA polymerase sigma-70 factor, ECF subfamily
MGTPTMTIEDAVRHRLVEEFDTGFTMMVEEFQGGIYAGALRLTGHRQDAQEVAQDTFVRAYAALGRFDDTRLDELRIGPWLWTIALNLIRTRASRPRGEVPLEERHQPASHDSEPLDDEVWNRRLATLNADQRTAVVLRHVLDLPINDISLIVERPEGTVKADISRGLARLRSTIQAEEAP